MQLEYKTTYRSFLWFQPYLCSSDTTHHEDSKKKIKIYPFGIFPCWFWCVFGCPFPLLLQIPMTATTTGGATTIETRVPDIGTSVTLLRDLLLGFLEILLSLIFLQALLYCFSLQIPLSPGILFIPPFFSSRFLVCSSIYNVQFWGLDYG